MTTQSERGQEKKFVRAVLPWVVAATALIVYLITLNPWISLSGLGYVARDTGQLWSPELTRPLFFLVTYPFHWLPATMVPAALNLFSAVCAALTLALLARSVALLPHDRTHEQRLREYSEFSLLSLPTAWIPPILAAAVCGLQLSFWTSATTASSSLFELLLFAYVVRCLLEYRIAGSDSWMLRAALVYGAAMTDNWLMIALLPAFIAAVVWIKGFSFFNLNFLGKMFLCGIAGLLLYLVLPLIYVLSGSAAVSFWQALKVNLGGQKAVLLILLHGIPKSLLLLLATTSVVPILLIGIRWASYFGDSSRLGITITTSILHVAHAALLAACVWVAFDPSFSPQHKGFFLPALYYLGSLSVGYFTGYFLLVFRPLLNRPSRRPQTGQKVVYRLSQVVVWALLFLVPAGLIYKNLPEIKMTNGPALKHYASALTEGLPENSVILSDDPARLMLAQAWMMRGGRAKNCLFLDTQALPVPAYQAYQAKRHPKEWPIKADPRSTNKIGDVVLVRLLGELSRKHPVYYLHPSFGYYFEFFYEQPHGLALELKPYSTNSLVRPPLSKGLIAQNDKFWKQNRQSVEQLVPFIQPPSSDEGGFRQWFLHRLHIPFNPNPTAVTLGRIYSQALDFWGVELQRHGRLKSAGKQFKTAVALNADNIAATANLKVNADLIAGRRLSMDSPQSVREEISKYRSWFQVLRTTGPFDDPAYCYLQGLTYVKGGLLHEAAEQFERVHALVPDFPLASFWLARLYAERFPERALHLIARIEAHPEQLASHGIKPLDISVTKVMALFSAHKTGEADRIMKAIIHENPTNHALLATVAQISSRFGSFTNALDAVDRELRIKPDDQVALVSKGYLYLQTGNYKEAIPPLTRALTINTNNQTARFDRAIAYLRCNELDRAQKDYKRLEVIYPRAFQIYYGLGEIAWRRNETNAAIRYYRLYMDNCVTNSEEAQHIRKRLESLTRAAH